MPTITERLQHAWSAFRNNRDPTSMYSRDYGYGSSYRRDRVRLTRGNERSIVNAMYNRIAVDVASNTLIHARLDQNGRFVETINSGLNSVFSLEANVDQTSRDFIKDIVLSMFDEGCVAAVPISANLNPDNHNNFDIQAMRTAKIVQWYPDRVRVQIYNDVRGEKEELVFPKKAVAIIENPFYAIMNEPNSTLQRLIHKLNLLDAVDEQSSSGKLDMIIQLPYIIKSPTRKEQAETRREELERQLSGSKYGIAYTDGTEKITQLNRPLENNLLAQVEYLTKMVYGQLGFTEAIIAGNATEQELLNYNNRIIEPILSAIADEFKRKFLSKTARTQGQSIIYFHDPFRLVPVNNIADIADKFTRNEILSSNEVRGLIGFKPVDDPDANALRNKNLNQSEEEIMAQDAAAAGGDYEFNPQDFDSDELRQLLLESGGDPEMVNSLSDEEIFALFEQEEEQEDALE